mgnify:CR=1 FL=1
MIESLPAEFFEGAKKGPKLILDQLVSTQSKALENPCIYSFKSQIFLLPSK